LLRCIALLFLLAVSSFAQSFTKTDYAVGSNPRGIVSTDFNGDGVADLAVANSGNASVSVLMGRGDGTFGSPNSIAVSPNPSEIIAVDLNNDNIPDLAVAAQGAITILYMHTDGSATRFDYQVNGTVTSVTTADFNRDSKPDIAGAVGGNVLVLLNQFDESFMQSAMLAPEVPATVVRAGDINRDGVADIAIGSCCQGTDVTFGAYFVATGQGDGTFTVAKAFDESDGTKLAVADVTGDGLADLVMPYQGCHTPCAGVEVAINQGSSFQRFGGSELGTLNYAGPGQAAIGSFNGGIQVAVPFGPGDYTSDGNGSALDKVLIFTVGSDGKFSSQGDFAIGKDYGTWGIVAADFNHDGKTDLAVSDTRVGKITVLLNDTGSSSAKPDFALTTNFSPQTVKAGDKTQYQYVLEATNGVLPQVQLSCEGMPQGATCAFDNTIPGQVTVGWVTIQTTARASALLRPNRLVFFAVVLPFGFVALPVLRRRRAFAFGIMLLAIVLWFQTGCAGGTGGANSTETPSGTTSTGTTGASGSPNSGGNAGGSTTGSGGTTPGSGGSGTGGGSTTTTGPTPAGTFQVTITATGGGVTHTQVVTLNVQ
jgi:hypothetical protein